MTLSEEARLHLNAAIKNPAAQSEVAALLDALPASKTAAGVRSVTMGLTTTDKVAFFGTTPIVQRAGAAQAAVTTTAATSTTPFGYAQAQADAIATLVNECRAALLAFGLIKGSA